MRRLIILIGLTPVEKKLNAFRPDQRLLLFPSFTATGLFLAAKFTQPVDTIKPDKMAKKNLFDEADSDSEGNQESRQEQGSEFKINKEYAQRFEHNKKREERQRRRLS